MTHTGYRVQTKSEAYFWRTVRTWPAEAPAVSEALALAGAGQTIEGVRRRGRELTLRAYPLVRVTLGRTVVWQSRVRRERVH